MRAEVAGSAVREIRSEQPCLHFYCSEPGSVLFRCKVLFVACSKCECWQVFNPDCASCHVFTDNKVDAINTNWAFSLFMWVMFLHSCLNLPHQAVFSVVCSTSCNFHVLLNADLGSLICSLMSEHSCSLHRKKNQEIIFLQLCIITFSTCVIRVTLSGVAKCGNGFGRGKPFRYLSIVQQPCCHWIQNYWLRK